MIKKLSSELIREIAAGEVISAPVDVIKELVENALDASASMLEIQLFEAGIEKIIITDNGVGIVKEELALSLEKHSTSKLESLDSINSLGFRGEGLYAIANSARIAITSRPHNQLGGSTVVVENNEISFTEHPAKAGTKIEVSRLFANLPARRSGLESKQEELRKITNLLSKYILHYPKLKLKLIVDKKERWNYAGGSYSEAVKFFWGAVSANRLLVLNAQNDSYKLFGLISRPELSRPRRDRLLLAVNGRPIVWEERWLKPIFSAYKELLPKNQFPVGVLNLKLDVKRVLVNTSPDKMRLRFLDEQEVLSFLKQAIEGLLSTHPLAPALPDLSSFEAISPAPNHSFPRLKYIATYQELYILAEAETKLWIIDQHAAHERILYEELSKRYKNEKPIELSHAELIELSADEVEIYLTRAEGLANIGIRLEPFGGKKWRIRTVPAFLANQNSLIAEIIKSSLAKNSALEAWRAVLGRLACLPAIKAGYKIPEQSSQNLLDQLYNCQTPWVCPHGRPTALVLSELELARRFGRPSARSTETKIQK